MEPKRNWAEILFYIVFAGVAVAMWLDSSIVTIDTGRNNLDMPAHQNTVINPSPVINYETTTQQNVPITQTAPVYYSNPEYKYNYRTGTSGDYTYNYDVYGNNVNGNCDMHGKYGECTIIDEDGNTQYVEAEWVRNGVMEVTDESGYSFEMEVE